MKHPLLMVTVDGSKTSPPESDPSLTSAAWALKARARVEAATPAVWATFLTKETFGTLALAFMVVATFLFIIALFIICDTGAMGDVCWCQGRREGWERHGSSARAHFETPDGAGGIGRLGRGGPRPTAWRGVERRVQLTFALLVAALLVVFLSTSHPALR